MADTAAVIAPAASNSSIGKKRTGLTVFFCLSALFFSIVVLAVNVTPMMIRDSLVGPIDSYFYVAKAEQILTCPKQDCPAVTDLWEQSYETDTGNAKTSEFRRKVQQRVHYHYHAAHAVMLGMLNSAGVSWETGMNVLSILGAVLISAGLAGFLYSLWGKGGAALGLVYLAFEVFPGFHGIHWIVPSTFALGIGLCLWTLVLQKHKWLPYILPIGVLALVWMHPVGKAYAGVAMVLFAGLMPWNKRQTWSILVVAGFAWITQSLAASFFDRPLFGSGSFLLPADWDYWQGFLGNAQSALGQFMGRFGDPLGLVVLTVAAYGLIAAPRQNRTAVFLVVGVICALSLVSLVHMLPGYPGELFRRLWVPLIAVIAGAFGFGAWTILNTARAWMTSGKIGNTRRVAAGSAALLVAAVYAGQVLTGTPSQIKQTTHMTLWADFDVDTTQPGRILASVPEDERILYMDELSLYLYLAYGGSAHGAVFQPSLSDTPLEQSWLSAETGIGTAVSNIPDFYGSILLQDHSEIQLAFDTPVQANDLSIRINNPRAGETTLRIDGFEPVTAAAKSYRWVSLIPTDATALTSRLSLIVETGGYSQLRGLRLSKDQHTNWPWQTGAILRKYRHASETERQSDPIFETRIAAEAVIPEACSAHDIVEDSGATVVLRVSCDARSETADKNRHRVVSFTR